MKPALLLVAWIGLLPLQGLAQERSREQTPWQPGAEPQAWAVVRQSLVEKGPPQGLVQRDWIFMRALDRPDLRAGEYLADRQLDADTPGPVVGFTAVVLLQRPQQGEAWQVRERRMRALCDQQRLQVLEASGEWVAYAGKPDPQAGARLAWICSSAATGS